MSTNNKSCGMSRGWLIASGILFILTGFAAMALPVFFTVVVVKALAFFILASGVFSLGMALVGKHQGYRLLEILSGLIRIAAGIALLYCLKQSALVITIAFAIYLMVEGVFVILASLKLRPTPGWAWSLVNGVAALILGILIYLRWPSSSFTVLGIFFGINLLCKGAAQLALGFSPRSAIA
ncbi:MAG: hypothetical protein EHM17_08330 [Verrucomicrobiaceae bacterium]|nr:MAG: hypothetical protein EHM17_08330 [Verrucomicrobiaceae bacterium]